MVSRSTYLEQRSRRFGGANPQRMDFEHWVEMVGTAETAYAAGLASMGNSRFASRMRVPR